MPEQVIDRKSAPYFLLFLVPSALALSTVFVAWRQILALTALFVGVSIFQLKKWQEKAKSIDPIFQKSIVQSRGEITAMDLSIAANISGKDAAKYLAEKAQEFGTRSRQYADRGQVYYFISVSTLGNIFDDSEEEAEAVDVVSTIAASQPPIALFESPPEPAIAMELAPILETMPESVEPAIAMELAPIVDTIPDSVSSPATPVTQSLDLREVLEDIPPQNPTADLPTDRPIVKILQSELAKRLDVHSSTIYKRRSEPDFTDWTRNRDPEGLAWAYAQASKEYYRVDD
jgi:hypothetical protein